MLPMLAVGWRASELKGEEAGRFHKVACVSINQSINHHHYMFSTQKNKKAETHTKQSGMMS